MSAAPDMNYTLVIKQPGAEDHIPLTVSDVALKKLREGTDHSAFLEEIREWS